MIKETAEPSARRRPPVGRHIRQWRTERGLTIRALADASGLNGGYLSQLENDKASPSLDTLVALSEALGVPVSWLVLDEAPTPRVVRFDERERWQGEGGIDMSDVTGTASHDIRIVSLTMPPGRRSGLHAHDGEEGHLVLRGRGRFTYGDQVVELGPGDYMAFDGRIPHDGQNVADTEGEVLLITILR
jgi:transcriptional regulator with XRE-family HTH domain